MNDYRIALNFFGLKKFVIFTTYSWLTKFYSQKFLPEMHGLYEDEEASVLGTNNSRYLGTFTKFYHKKFTLKVKWYKFHTTEIWS